jgi:hypothetical protein
LILVVFLDRVLHSFFATPNSTQLNPTGTILQWPAVVVVAEVIEEVEIVVAGVIEGVEIVVAEVTEVEAIVVVLPHAAIVAVEITEEEGIVVVILPEAAVVILFPEEIAVASFRGEVEEDVVHPLRWKSSK